MAVFVMPVRVKDIVQLLRNVAAMAAHERLCVVRNAGQLVVYGDAVVRTPRHGDTRGLVPVAPPAMLQ